MLINKSKILYDRDEEGELIPKEVSLELTKDKDSVYIIPMVEGLKRKLQSVGPIYDRIKMGKTVSDVEVSKMKNIEKEIILKCLKTPNLTDEDYKFLRDQYKTAIFVAIVSETIGMKQKQIGLKTNITDELVTSEKKIDTPIDGANKEG